MEKVNVPRNMQQALDLANKIKEIRRNKFKGNSIDLTTLLRLKEMPYDTRYTMMERLVCGGFADSVEDIERMLLSKEVTINSAVGSSPTESVGMSDDILDSSIQYLKINKEFL